MNGLRISELAARTGFSPPTLRYYERIGVLPPPDRTEGGYRVYGERTVDLLQFITRAKALGLSLEETAELAALWSGDRCEPVQSRLATLVHEKLDDARTRLSELSAFIDQLESVSKQLGGHVPDGRAVHDLEVLHAQHGRAVPDGLAMRGCRRAHRVLDGCGHRVSLLAADGGWRSDPCPPRSGRAP